MQEAPQIIATRHPNSPLITFESHPSLGDNINGPSLIRVPDWVEKPLGRYYLYFGHHKGQFIRLAYADTVEGPWNIYVPGLIPLEQVPAFHHHLASPDVHIDPKTREIIMFLHGPVKNGENDQMTVVARSSDGLHFNVENELLGRSYFRAFQYKDTWYAIANCGDFYRSKDISAPWELKTEPLIPVTRIEDQFGIREHASIRHSAMILEGGFLYLFYSRKGDAPERIQCVKFELTDDWNTWQMSEAVDVLHPEADYEGIAYELKPSKSGYATGVQELRDPAIYREDNKLWLLYSYGGEEGIALAELKIKGINQ